jgi:hypothetical protein
MATGKTRLRAGDEVLVFAESDMQPALPDIFERPVAPDG